MQRSNPTADFRRSLAAALTIAVVVGGAFAQVALAAPGDISTVAGNGAYGSSGDGGPATAAAIGDVEGVFFSPGGGFHLTEGAGRKVRYVNAGGLISTVAGGGSNDPGDGGLATAALLGYPEQVIRDHNGNVYLSEGDRVRRVSTLGIITTVAGTGTAGFSGDGGPATAAQLDRPHGMALDLNGNLFIADNDNHRIRRVSALGVITTVAGTGTPGFTGDGGPATAAQLSNPVDVGIDTAGRIFIASNGNHAVRMVNAAGNISTVAGTGTPGFSGDGGPATAARINGPQGVDVDGAGNVYIAESTNHIIRRFSVGGTITTVAGTATTAGFTGDGGPATAAQLNGPREVSFDYATGDFYISDRFNNRVRRVQALGVPEIPPTVSIDSAPASPGNDPTPTWSFSVTSSQQVTFQCRLTRGATVVSDWTSCSSPRTYDLSLEPDGTYTFAVRAVTVSGVGNPTTSNYVLDTTAPGAPSIGSGPASPGTDQTPTWGFSGEAGASFECRLTRGATVVSDWTSCSSPRTYDLSLEPDGTYTFGVRQTDAAGNTSAPASANYVLDTTAPGAPSIGSGPASPGTDQTPTWGFSGEAGASFECRLEDGVGQPVAGYDWAGCSTPRTYDLSGSPDGTYTFAVRQSDGAGTTGPAATSGYVLDTAAPAAPAITGTPGAAGSSTNPAWSFTGPAGASFECRLEDGVGQPVAGYDWAGCSTPRSYDLSTHPDDVYTFSVRAVDAAGNVGAAASDAYDLDRVPPAPPVLTGAPGAVGNDETPTWSFTAEPGATLECRLERSPTVVSDWQSCTSPTTYDLASEPDGPYRLLVRAADAAGNVGPATQSDYDLDRVPPVAPTIDSNPGAVGASRAPSWSFTGESGAVHECRLTRGATVVADWNPCAGSAAYDLAGEPDGTYTFGVRGRDQAGNTGPAASSDYRLDTVGADVTIQSGPGPLGNSATPEWSFSGEPVARFECSLERAGALVFDWASCSSPHGYDLGSEPDGAYTFRVRSRDDANNLGAAVPYAYELDRAAPAAPDFTSSPGALGNDTTPRWELTAETGAVVECRLLRDGAAVGPWEPCAGERRVDLAAQGDGDYALAARATDAASNTGPSAQSAYRLDATAPDAPWITDSPGASGRDATVSWAFTGERGADFECRLVRGATIIDAWGSCTGRARYDLTDSLVGGHLFNVRARDRAGNLGPATSSDYELLRTEVLSPLGAPMPGGAAPASPRDRNLGGRSRERASRDRGRRTSRSEQRDRSRSRERPAARGGGSEPSGPADRGIADGQFLDRVGRAAGEVAQRAAFPGLLFLLMLLFFAIQDRIDRREPKLALAPINDEPYLSYMPPNREGSHL